VTFDLTWLLRRKRGRGGFTATETREIPSARKAFRRLNFQDREKLVKGPTPSRRGRCVVVTNTEPIQSLGSDTAERIKASHRFGQQGTKEESFQEPPGVLWGCGKNRREKKGAAKGIRGMLASREKIDGLRGEARSGGAQKVETRKKRKRWERR